MKRRTSLGLMMALVLMVAFSSCRKPYQEQLYEIVNPNETAFVIPLEEGTKEGQAALKSEDYLMQKKVAAKRIYVPTQWHQNGRRSWQGKWIKSVRVIKVDRAPVTREWTAADGTGTQGNVKEDIEVESKESIGFGIGITATASIPEDWAAKFLYNYNGKTLAQVMDNDVRAYIQNILTSEFGIRNLSKCQAERKIIFESMRVQTIEYFADMGVRIMNIGAAGQFNYLDPAIQTAINEKFASEMKITAANNEVAAAQAFARAQSSIKAQKQLDADIEIKKALAEALRGGKLPVPNTLVIGEGQTLMDVYAAGKLGGK
jgi:hypothetical protein